MSDGYRIKQWKTAYNAARSVVTNRASKVVISGQAGLDSQGLAFFEEAVADTSCYLEYGSGGSTVFAYKYVDVLVSVESDRQFLKAVDKVLDTVPSAADRVLIPVDIGFTEEWGKPVFQKPTRRRVKRWSAYPTAPWRFFSNRQIEPELILIDGRFRVACTLETLLKQGKDSTATILLDDYTGRPHYSIVETFADLIDVKGRMAVLRKKPRMDQEQCELILKNSYKDYR